MAKITQQQLLGILSKVSPRVAVAKAVIGTVKQVTIEKFGYDFLGLGIRLFVFFAVAFLIEAYFKAKIAINDIINDPSKQVAVVSGLFGIVGIVFNFLFQSTQNQEDNPDTPAPIASDFFNSEILRQVFSTEGYHGFHYWDIIKIISILLVVMEWRRFSAMTKATGGQVQPLTNGLFLIIIIGLGLTLVPQFIERIKHSYINVQAMR